MSRFPLIKALLFSLLALCGYSPAQIKLPPSAEVQRYSAQAASALRANRTAEAEQAYHAILKIDPANVDARANLGIVEMVEQNWAKAGEDFRKAIKLKPSLWNAQALLGLCALHLGNAAEGSQLLTRALPQLKAAKLRLEAGLPAVEILHQSGELARAASLVGEMQQLDPTNLDVLYAAYRVYSDLSMNAVNSMALAGPDSVQLHRALAEHSVNDGRLEDALSEYRKALDLNPNAPGVDYEYGQALLAQSHLEANLALAQKEFETALSQNPADARPECALGRIAMWRSDTKSAFDHYERAVKLNPDLACGQLGVADALLEAGKTTEALAHLESAARSAPQDPEVRHRLGALYLRLGRKEDADREMAAFKELQKVQDQLQKALLGSQTGN